MSVSVKEEFDYLWIKFKRDIKFKNKYQCDNVKKVIKTGDKDHLYSQFFYLYQKLNNNSNNVNTNDNTNDNINNILLDKEIKELNIELKDTTKALDNQMRRNTILEEKITKLRCDISSREYDINILKGLEKPSIFDEEPINAKIDNNYNPYDITPQPFTEMTMNDYSPQDIHYVLGQVGSDKWEKSTKRQQLSYMVKYLE